MGMIDTVAGDVGLCHEVTPAGSNAALEKVDLSNTDMIVICFLGGYMAVPHGDGHFIIEAKERSNTCTDCEPHV